MHSSSFGSVFHARDEKLVSAGNERLDSWGRLARVREATAVRVDDESDCRAATFSTSMLPDMLVMPSSVTVSGPSAATTIEPAKVEHVDMSVASWVILMV